MNSIYLIWKINFFFIFFYLKSAWEIKLKEEKNMTDEETQEAVPDAVEDSAEEAEKESEDSEDTE